MGFRVQGSGLGFRVQGLGFRVQGSGFGVQGYQLGDHRHLLGIMARVYGGQPLCYLPPGAHLRFGVEGLGRDSHLIQLP